MSGQPNLFRHATKELSQDAFICWLLDWADAAHAQANPHLHRAGCLFLEALLAAHDQHLSPPYTIKVKRQVCNVDILAHINDNLVLLIEDKTSSGEHSNQLERYKKSIVEKYPDKKVLPIFLKTGDQSNYKEAEKYEYKLFLRKDFIAVLQAAQKHGADNHILSDFLAHLESWEDDIEKYKTTPVKEWGKSKLWVGFFKQLQKKKPDLEWGYVNNQSGGFHAAWWCEKTVRLGGCEADFKVYWQIEESSLSFKMVDLLSAQGKNPKWCRDFWYKRLNFVVETTSSTVRVDKPKRFGHGRTMTVSKSIDWLAEDPNGYLDFEKTLENLAAAENLMADAVDYDRIPWQSLPCESTNLAYS